MITTRCTHRFIELKAQSLEEAIFKGENEQIESLIDNLKEVIDQLEEYKEGPHE